MNFEVKAVGFTMSEEERLFAEKKIERFKKNEDYLTSLVFTFAKEGPDIKAEAVAHFKWGANGHLAEVDHDFKAAVDKLVDKLQVKITKEKEKAADKR